MHDAESTNNGENFSRIKIYRKKKVPIILNQKLFVESLMPTGLYCSETCATTKEAHRLLAVAERRMERIITITKLVDRKPKEWLRRVMKDLMIEARARKFKWAMKISSMKNDKWAKKKSQIRCDGFLKVVEADLQ